MRNICQVCKMQKQYMTYGVASLFAQDFLRIFHRINVSYCISMVWKTINGEELSKFRIKYIFLKKKDLINIIFDIYIVVKRQCLGPVKKEIFIAERMLMLMCI